ncbi:MAG: hypothetical protein ABIJ31_09675 [Pseudomonadota bacterium]
MNVLQTIISGAFTISGVQNKNLRGKLKSYSTSQVSRILKRWHVHGMIKKVAVRKLFSLIIEVAFKK